VALARPAYFSKTAAAGNNIAGIRMCCNPADELHARIAGFYAQKFYRMFRHRSLREMNISSDGMHRGGWRIDLAKDLC
jgi:hypothetical protein